jgi:hypothetical protein
MPSFNFKKQFAGLVEAGVKTQTIRQMRKRPIRVGDDLYLFTGLRTSKCRRLITTVATEVIAITIDHDEVVLGCDPLRRDQVCELAKADGFESVSEFKDFFSSHYGFPFFGQLIKWHPPTGLSEG